MLTKLQQPKMNFSIRLFHVASLVSQLTIFAASFDISRDKFHACCFVAHVTVV
jgi:hypothetical protein